MDFKTFKLHKWIGLLVTIGFTLGIPLACATAFPPVEKEYYASDGEYVIDTNSILTTLSQDSINVFVPFESAHPTPKSQNNKSVAWSYSDFMHIVRAFHQWHWKESIDAWVLSKLEYQVDCNEFDLGPYFLAIQLYRTKQIEGMESRFVHTIQISLPRSSVYWSEAERHPAVDDWGVMDLNRVKISAEQALDIAERVKGHEVRRAVENECEVYLTLAPYLSSDEWLIRYSSLSGEKHSRLLEVYIDIHSGEVRMVLPDWVP